MKQSLIKKIISVFFAVSVISGMVFGTFSVNAAATDDWYDASDLRAVQDSIGELEGFYLSQALDGLDYGPAELAALAEDVTKEDVQAIAESIECDLIYFLKGSGEEDGSDDETA